MKSLRLLAVLALFGCGFGCGEGVNPPPMINSVVGECAVNSDCDGDLVCRAAICAVVEDEPRALGFRLVPPPTSTYPAQTIGVKEIVSDMPVQIGLHPGVHVAGEIRWIGSDAGPGSGQLKFRSQTDDFSSETAVQANAYSLYVPTGTYAITFLPANPAQPTHVWRDVVVSLDTDPRLQLSRDHVRVLGTLVRTDALTGESHFVEEARVFATAPGSGVTSSVSVTDPNGNFDLLVPEDAGVFNLHIAPAEPNALKSDPTTPYVPEATFEGAFEVSGRQWSNRLDGQDTDVLAVSLGDYANVPIAVPVRLTLDGATPDWTGTTATLRTHAGHGTVTVRQHVDRDGVFELPLIAGVYEALVRTPAGHPARSMRLQDLEITSSGINLVLKSRPNVRGTVVGPNGEPLDAELRFVPVSDVAQQISVRTDEDGTYSTWLDTEPYTLTVLPSDTTLPRRVLQIENAELPETIQLSEAVVVWGSVFGMPSETSQTWEGVRDVAVHVLEKSNDALHVVGEGQTNEAGEFRIVLGTR